jgi:hypothetical protein
MGFRLAVDDWLTPFAGHHWEETKSKYRSFASYFFVEYKSQIDLELSFNKKNRLQPVFDLSG